MLIDPDAAKIGPVFGEVPDIPNTSGEPSSSPSGCSTTKGERGEFYMFVISAWCHEEVENLIWKLISSVHITYVRRFLPVQRMAASTETRASQVKGI